MSIIGQPGSAMVGPVTGAAAVTPADGSDLDRTARALWVGVAGDVVVVLQDGSEVTLKGVQGLLPAVVKRVKATDTTATDIVALY